MLFNNLLQVLTLLEEAKNGRVGACNPPTMPVPSSPLSPQSATALFAISIVRVPFYITCPVALPPSNPRQSSSAAICHDEPCACPVSVPLCMASVESCQELDVELLCACSHRCRPRSHSRPGLRAPQRSPEQIR